MHSAPVPSSGTGLPMTARPGEERTSFCAGRSLLHTTSRITGLYKGSNPFIFFPHGMGRTLVLVLFLAGPTTIAPQPAVDCFLG